MRKLILRPRAEVQVWVGEDDGGFLPGIEAVQLQAHLVRSRDKGLVDLIERTIDLLANGEPLESKFRDHPLKGGYAGCRECHLKPDLLLIYVQTREELRMVRLGSHSELFA